MIKHWVRENGKSYWVGPEEEMCHETDVECEPQPSINHKWVDGVWVLDKELEKIHLQFECEEELRRTDKFMVIDSELSNNEIKEAKEYRKSLRDLLKGEDIPKPEFPEFLKEYDEV